MIKGIRAALLLLLAIVLLPLPSPGEPVNGVTFQWYGQACFVIKTREGTVIVTDPVQAYGYTGPRGVAADIVTLSHNHGDHTACKILRGKPKVVRGLMSRGRKFHSVKERIRDVFLYNLKTFHDSQGGKKYGLNAVFVLEFDGLRVVHCGDLGHTLNEDQIREIGRVDVLLIPVGGKYTLDEREADKIVEQLNPRKVIIPMHYRTDRAKFLPSSVEDFIRGKASVIRLRSSRFNLETGETAGKPRIVVLEYQ